MFLPRPKARKQWLPLESLTFDARLQMRHLFDANGQEQMFDDEWVALLLELRTSGAEFEPLEAVEETRKGKQPVLWVFRGFHRGEVYRRAGENLVEVQIYPGTFADAQFYSLCENSKQPKPRTAADCRKAFDTLIDTPHLLGRALEAAKDQDGIQRALAAACGLGKSVIGKYLKERGLVADRKSRKLIPVAVPETAPPPPLPPPARVPEPEDPRDDREARQSRVQTLVSAAGDPELAGAKDSLADVAKQLRSVGRAVESLLKSRAGDLLRAKAKANLVPFTIITRARDNVMPREGDANPMGVDRIETWPALATFQAVFAQVSAAIAEAELWEEV